MHIPPSIPLYHPLPHPYPSWTCVMLKIHCCTVITCYIVETYTDVVFIVVTIPVAEDDKIIDPPIYPLCSFQCVLLKLWIPKQQYIIHFRIILEVRHNVASALSTPTRNVRFLHSAFDATGDSFVASDYQGNIFRFDINKNR